MEDRKIWWDSAQPERRAAGYVAQVEDVRPVLAEMEDRGLPVDDEKRLSLGVEFEAAENEARKELDSRFPDSARKIQPYKTVPDAVKKMLEELSPTMMPSADLVNDKGKPLGKGAREKLERAAREARWEGVTEQELAQIRSRRFQESPTKNDEGEEEPGEFYYFDRLWLRLDDAGKKMVKGQITDMGAELRWCKLYEFSPNSSKQLMAYMEAKRHKIPMNKDKKKTTGKKELIRLSVKMKDNFYVKVIECRELSKMRGTYIDGFCPHEDGCVHTTFTFATAIGQLSCCAAWTPVVTKRGEIPIKDVVVGDMVWTHQQRWRPVTATWIHPPGRMVEVHFSNGKVLTCTISHRMLVSTNECIEAMDETREHRSSVGSVSSGHCSDLGRYSQEIEDLSRHHQLCTNPQHASRRVQGIAEAALLTIEAGQQESNEGKIWGTESSLEGRSRRWVRVYDLLSQWQEGVRTSGGNGQGVRYEEVAEEVRGSSHRRGWNEQRSGQSRSSDKSRAQVYSLVAENGLDCCSIEKVVLVGCFPVHDITIEEDESYLSCGVFSHNSRNPNIQNFSKHGRLAKVVREMIAAKPGKLLSEWDFKSCHVLTLGYLANDPNYIRLARIDMHSIMTGHFLKLWRVQNILHETDKELKDRCKWLKSNEKYKDIRDSKVKHAGLGIGNGLQANGLFERYMEFFSGVGEAKAILAAYEEVFPKVFAWQKRMQKLAHDQNFLQTEFGYIRHYFEVFRWDSARKDWGHGDQGEEAISFWLSNIAFGHIREKMKELKRAGLAERYGLCNNVHDSFLFHFDEGLLEEHLRLVRPILQSPSKVLIGPAAPEGLWIGVDCGVGRNWAEMEEVNVAAVKVGVGAGMAAA
jgi:DNA polymerase I-like protein with 3'-5' exonuclease and polymerase domains